MVYILLFVLVTKTPVCKWEFLYFVILSPAYFCSKMDLVAEPTLHCGISNASV